MTDRVHSLTVVLDSDIREDDIQRWVEAICLLKHVISVTPRVANLDSHMAEERAKRDLQDKIWAVVK